MEDRKFKRVRDFTVIDNFNNLKRSKAIKRLNNINLNDFCDLITETVINSVA